MKMIGPVIEASSLTKRYKGTLALDNVSFRIKEGEIVGLVGKNGAGKTTLLRCLTGIVKPTSGSVSILGVDDPKGLIKVRGEMAAMIETPALYSDLSGYDNLMCRALLMGKKGEEAKTTVNSLLNFVGLSAIGDNRRPSKNYSLGMKQRLGIAIALVGDPKILILDEPTNGLDPEGIKQIRELLLRVNREKEATIIVSSHILSELSKFASSYLFIDKGRLIKQVTATEMERKEGKALNLSTSDDVRALLILRANHYSAFMSGDSLIINGLSEPSIPLNLLYASGITLKKLKEESNDLEKYFVSLVGDLK